MKQNNNILSPASAATVKYYSGSYYNYVVGNRTDLGGSVGIGGTNSLPVNNQNATGNTVNVTGGMVNDSIFGGRYVVFFGAGGASNNNQVNITDFVGCYAISGGYAVVSFGAGAATTANGNEVSIFGGRFIERIFGGYSQSKGPNGAAFANNNVVRLTRVITGNDVVGGLACVVLGAGSVGITANGNAVIVTDSEIGGNVDGGRPRSFTQSGARIANGNCVTLVGTTDILGSVYGGWSNSDKSPYNNGLGNTLNVRRPKNGGITVGGHVQYFQRYNFEIPADMAANGTMLKVNGTAYINGATINVGIDGASSPLQVGDKITLIDAAMLDGMPVNVTANGRGMPGATLKYAFDLATPDRRQLIATVSRIGPARTARARRD